MTYKSVGNTIPTVCTTCWTVVQQCDQDKHDQTVHANPGTVVTPTNDGYRNHVASWTEPVIADKNTCYHPNET